MTSFITSITKGRKKTPEQLVRLALRDLFDIIETQDSTVAELKSGVASPQDDLCKRLSQLKVILYGDGERAEVDEEKVVDVSRRIQEVFGLFFSMTMAGRFNTTLDRSYEYHSF